MRNSRFGAFCLLMRPSHGDMKVKTWECPHKRIMIQNSNGGFRGMVSSEYNDRDYHLVQLPPHCKASICMLIKKQRLNTKKGLAKGKKTKGKLMK